MSHAASFLRPSSVALSSQCILTLNSFRSISLLHSHSQSEIEEALVRIKNLEGVEGYVVCNNEGTVLRHQADMDKKVAEELAKVMLCCGVSPREIRLRGGLATFFCSSFSLYTPHHLSSSLHLSISFSSSQESNQTSITSYQCCTRSRS